ncbi:MAG TPA: pilus assembly protein PilM [Verrucomicrobiae bacterium]
MFKRKANPEQGLPANVVPFRKRKAIAAIDLDGDTLRVVHASGQGSSARVTRIESAPLEIPAEKKDDLATVGAALKLAFDKLKSRPKEIVLAFPRGQVVLRPLQVPMVADVRELASIINFQIAKDLPFRVEDAVVDFKVLRAIEVPATADAPEPQRRLDVLVGAAKNDIVQFYREATRLAGAKLVGLGLRSIAAAHYAIRCQDSDGPFLLVSVRGEEVTLEIVSGGKLVFSRVAVVDRENLLKSLEIEVVRSLTAFEGSGGSAGIQRVIVSGGTGSEAEISKTLAARLKLPAEVLQPSVCIDVKNVEPLEIARSVAPIGLALSALEPGGLLIDFANPKKPAVQRNTKRTRTIVAVAAAVAILFTMFGVRANLVKKRKQVRDTAMVELKDAEKKLPIYRRGKLQTKTIQAWMAEEQNWLDHLAYLSGVLPNAEEIYVSAFTTTPQHVIRFSVQAKTGELLAQLDKKLRAAGYEVKPLSITPASDKHGYNFRTTVELSIPKKLKPDISNIKPAPRPPDDASIKSASANPVPNDGGSQS